jgi:alkylhydroperoxidase family enzyme
VTGRRDPDPDAARLQALLPLAPTPLPRIPPARPRQLRPLARFVAQLTGRLTRSGPPNIFTTLGQHPRLFRAWLYYSAHLMPFGRLPRPDAELVILRVAWRCRSAYEWRQHVPLALRVGLTPEQIDGVAANHAADSLTEHQRTLLAVADDLLEQRAISEPTWPTVRATLTDHELIELCLLIGHYQGLATAIGGLAIEPETPQNARRRLTHSTRRRVGFDHRRQPQRPLQAQATVPQLAAEQFLGLPDAVPDRVLMNSQTPVRTRRAQVLLQ